MWHENILKFKTEDGQPLREFRDLHHMHAVIMESWSRVVGPQDTVYHLGDVAFKREGLDLIKILPGKKRLVRGNHDLFKLRSYMDVFQEVYGVRQFDGYWLTHVPMHPGDMRFAKANIHGHLHKGVVTGELAEKYVNVCVEQINYTPVSWDDIKKRVENASGPG